MLRKGLMVTALAAVAAILAGQRKDIARYVKIKRLSTGEGHPELVPAKGGTAYPQHSSEAQADGTGDFDSASRGGPAH
ncbi:MAG TPA: hypothetical protein VHY58_21605 [Streptosporangiaceae bacterium]|jgi:hypothetical protein|nr:hypothetical protein [Streptosporangiaceae bacterium]